MAELRLKVAEKDLNGSISCGVGSIDNLMKEAYYKTLCKQGTAYDILLDDVLVGSCMLKIAILRDENEDYYDADKEFPVVEISYIAIDSAKQSRRIGTYVLRILISKIRDFSKCMPIRFIVIDAFEEKRKWYEQMGFGEYPKIKDNRFPNTVPMKMDLIDLEMVNRYVESC